MFNYQDIIGKSKKLNAIPKSKRLASVDKRYCNSVNKAYKNLKKSEKE